MASFHHLRIHKPKSFGCTRVKRAVAVATLIMCPLSTRQNSSPVISPADICFAVKRFRTCVGGVPCPSSGIAVCAACRAAAIALTIFVTIAALGLALRSCTAIISLIWFCCGGWCRRRGSVRSKASGLFARPTRPPLYEAPLSIVQ